MSFAARGLNSISYFIFPYGWTSTVGTRDIPLLCASVVQERSLPRPGHIVPRLVLTTPLVLPLECAPCKKKNKRSVEGRPLTAPSLITWTCAAKQERHRRRHCSKEHFLWRCFFVEVHFVTPGCHLSLSLLVVTPPCHFDRKREKEENLKRPGGAGKRALFYPIRF